MSSSCDTSPIVKPVQGAVCWKWPDKFNSLSHKDFFNADGTHEERAAGEVAMTVIKLQSQS